VLGLRWHQYLLRRDLMSETKIIKRYSNRKLYDTIESKYVTLNDISEMIRKGVDVKIIDNQTNKDITSSVLAHVLFNEEKSRSSLSINILKELIKSGQEALADYYKKRFLSRLNQEKVHNKGGNGTDSEGSVEINAFLRSSLEKIEKEFKLNIDEFLNTIPAVKKIREDMDRINERILRLESRLDAIIEKVERIKKNGDK
jgi:polyhydroxyalkanoate synthesis repressor PhaR